jgi:hypothetical protein
MLTRKNVQRFIQNSGRSLGGDVTFSDMTFNDEIFGELTPDAKYGEIVVQYKGIEYQIESREAIPNAHQIAAELERYVIEAKLYAVQNMLELKNETWTDENEDGTESLVSEEQFIERMTLESVSVSEDSSTFWFDDGQLFFGHVIAVGHDGTTWTDASFQG